MIDNFIHSDITEKILKAYFGVHNILGFGFLEKVYERALLIELKKSGLRCESQFPVKVFYGEKIIGDYFFRYFSGR